MKSDEEELKERIHTAEIKEGAVKEYCLLAHSSGITWFAFLYNPGLPTWPGVTILAVDYTSQSTIKPENAPHACQQAIWWRHLLNWGSVLLDDGVRLCEGDNKMTNI